MLKEKNHKFRNWAGNISAEIPNYYEPETEAELISIIQSHKSIRVVGSAHSWSETCVSGEALINLDRFDRIISIDRESKTIVVQAGIKLSELNKKLDGEGLALSNLGSIAAQSLAGAISTGTHGTGIGHQILGSQVIEFTLVKADGETVVINRDRDSKLFNAVIVNLGCLGIITQMTLKVEQAFNLHEITETMRFEDVVENINALLADNDHLKFWWLPPSNELIVYRYNKTLRPRNDWRLRQIVKDEIGAVVVYRTLVKIARLIPSFAPSVSRFMTRLYKGPLDRIEKSFRVFNVPDPPVHRETEWAFDRSYTKEILTTYREFILNTGHNFNFIQEIRFTKADDFWLSPSYRRDSLWIGFYNYEHEGWEELLPMHEEFARKFDGRPHWGKEFTVGHEYLKQCYQKFEDFAEIRKQFDSGEKFQNEYISKALQSNTKI